MYSLLVEMTTLLYKFSYIIDEITSMSQIIIIIVYTSEKLRTAEL